MLFYFLKFPTVEKKEQPNKKLIMKVKNNAKKKILKKIHARFVKVRGLICMGPWSFHNPVKEG